MLWRGQYITGTRQTLMYEEFRYSRGSLCSSVVPVLQALVFLNTSVINFLLVQSSLHVHWPDATVLFNILSDAPV